MATSEERTIADRIFDRGRNEFDPSAWGSSPLSLSDEQPTMVDIRAAGSTFDSMTTIPTDEQIAATGSQYRVIAGDEGSLLSLARTLESIGLDEQRSDWPSLGSDASPMVVLDLALRPGVNLNDAGSALRSPAWQVLGTGVATTIADFSEHYSISNDVDTRRFLAEHPTLVAVLTDALRHIKRTLNPSDHPRVRATKYSDEPGDVLLVVGIPVTTSVADAMARLDRFDEDWWLQQPEAVRRRVVFDVKFG